MKYISFAIIPLLAMGCSVSDDKPLADIDSALWEKICKAATEANDAETYECDGFDIEVEARTAEEAAADCVEASDGVFASGDCTFGDWRICNEWDPEDFCDPGNPPAECAALAECAAPAEE